MISYKKTIATTLLLHVGLGDGYGVGPRVGSRVGGRVRGRDGRGVGEGVGGLHSLNMHVAPNHQAISRWQYAGLVEKQVREASMHARVCLVGDCVGGHVGAGVGD